ncbi:TPA: hypothetical protein O1801_001570 [Staphylococcus aureus]|nr:hypothetical protein [Staphylococcus aureus]HDF0448339.1 hypothetical protein [Staphylococcus aureus]
MKRKVLVLTMGVLCATQLWQTNNAKALVTESGVNDTKQFTEVTSEEKFIKDAISKVNESFIYYPQNDLKGLGGEHNDYEKITYSTSSNNVLELSMSSKYVGGKSGAMVGYSEIYSSHFTDRDKRAIRRDHVKEAQNLINDYKYTQIYEDFAKATAKVSTLSQSHQNYLNKQIDKVNNKIEKTEKR